jgi:uncharacterized membrane protein YtjA (UPF0391 family)
LTVSLKNAAAKPEFHPHVGGTSNDPAALSWRRLRLLSIAPRSWRLGMGNLLHYALVFLVIALIAAAVGFGGVAGFAMEAARLLFWVFIVLFVISLVAGLVRR